MVAKNIALGAISIAAGSLLWASASASAAANSLNPNHNEAVRSAAYGQTMAHSDQDSTVRQGLPGRRIGGGTRSDRTVDETSSDVIATLSSDQAAQETLAVSLREAISKVAIASPDWTLFSDILELSDMPEPLLTE